MQKKKFNPQINKKKLYVAHKRTTIVAHRNLLKMCFCLHLRKIHL